MERRTNKANIIYIAQTKGDSAMKMKKFERLYSAASREVSKEVEHIARKHLLANPNLTEFIMGMGTYGFMADKPRGIDYDAGCEELNDLIAEWDNLLKITGEPMRFTATGEKRSDW